MNKSPGFLEGTSWAIYTCFEATIQPPRFCCILPNVVMHSLLRTPIHVDGKTIADSWRNDG